MICLSFRGVTLSEGVNPAKMKDRNSNEWTYDFQHKSIEWNKLHYMVNSDYRVYSAAKFKNGHRKKDNYEHGQNIIVLDIDNDDKAEYLSLKDAYELFKDYKCLISTTKSHQIGKNGLTPEDRYRVIIKLKKAIECSPSEYGETMGLIHKTLFRFSDAQCIDASRFYFGHTRAEYKYFDGEEFDFDLYYERMKATKSAEQFIKSTAPIKKFTNNAQYRKSNIIEEFNKNNSIESVLSKYGYKQQGQRWVSPNSSTGMAGVIIQKCNDGVMRAYNHHNADSWNNETAFGIYAHMEHNGDFKQAVKMLTNSKN